MYPPNYNTYLSYKFIYTFIQPPLLKYVLCNFYHKGKYAFTYADILDSRNVWLNMFQFRVWKLKPYWTKIDAGVYSDIRNKIRSNEGHVTS
jgi:hypothetical protein